MTPVAGQGGGHFAGQRGRNLQPCRTPDLAGQGVLVLALVLIVSCYHDEAELTRTE